MFVKFEHFYHQVLIEDVLIDDVLIDDVLIDYVLNQCNYFFFF